MITIGGFFLGGILIAVGFFMVWKANRLRQWVGDIATIIGYSWLDWPIVGMVTMLIGAFVMFGMWQAILLAIFGGLRVEQ